jgi:caffeoyl-CoA O-methyltransferase
LGKGLTPYTLHPIPSALIFAETFHMDLILPLVQAYAEKYTSPEDDLLQQINQQTQSHPQAHMLSGHIQGKLLELLSILLKPKRILEIGSFTGYSALCLAKGLVAGGELHTIELREEDAAVARQNFNLSDANDKIILHTGNALQIIPGLEEEWDLVFIDADKTGYIDYYRLVLPRLRKGGVILADNVFFHGEVLQPELKGKNAKAIQAFNEYIQQDDSVEQVLLTVRDGLMLIFKK